MKKLTCFLLTAMMLTMLSGCGGSSSSTAEESADRTETTTAETEATAEQTSSEAETTTTAADDSSEPDASSGTEDSGSSAASPDSGASADPASGSSGSTGSTGSTENSGNLLPTLLKKMNSTSDAVAVHSEYEEDGVTYRLDMIRFGSKLYYDVEVTDIYEMEICFDGTKGYMIDDVTQTFSDYSETDDLDFGEMIVDSDSIGECLASGTETFNGSTCRYEDYIENDTDGGEEEEPEEPETYRYYFDDNGNLTGCKILEEGIEMIYTIKFTESTDESVFSPPAGYTEIDEEEMMEQIYMRMLSAMMGE